jgi:hypothetical protein
VRREPSIPVGPACGIQQNLRKKEHLPAILVFATLQVEALSNQRELPTTRPSTNASSGGISLVMQMVYAEPAPVELPIEVIDMPLVMGATQRSVAI